MQDIQYFGTSVGQLKNLENSGRKWEVEELAALRENYNLGLSLHDICVRHKRPKSGVLNKLCELRILRYSSANYSYIVVAKPKKLVAAIHALTLDIEMLVEYVDGR